MYLSFRHENCETQSWFEIFVIIPFYGLVIRDTVRLNYLGHHIYPFAFIWSFHRELDLWWTQTPCDALPSLNLESMRFKPGTRRLTRLNIRGNVALTQQIMSFFWLLKLHFIPVSFKKPLTLKYKPQLSLLSSSDYKSFICASSVWSTWEAKTFSRDTQRSVAGSTRQPMKSTERTTFPYLRSASLYSNKAITVCCMRFHWMGSWRRKGKNGNCLNSVLLLFLFPV